MHLYSRIDIINHMSVYQRWRRSAAIAEELSNIIAEVDQFLEKFTFVSGTPGSSIRQYRVSDSQQPIPR